LGTGVSCPAGLRAQANEAESVLLIPASMMLVPGEAPADQAEGMLASTHD